MVEGSAGTTSHVPVMPDDVLSMLATSAGSHTIDATLGGVGSLTYYGDPKTVNTTGGGLGSISKGK